MNIITFGKYKDMPVTRVLRIDPSYFGWYVLRGDIQ